MIKDIARINKIRSTWMLFLLGFFEICSYKSGVGYVVRIFEVSPINCCFESFCYPLPTGKVWRDTATTPEEGERKGFLVYGGLIYVVWLAPQPLYPSRACARLTYTEVH